MFSGSANIIYKKSRTLYGPNDASGIVCKGLSDITRICQNGCRPWHTTASGCHGFGRWFWHGWRSSVRYLRRWYFGCRTPIFKGKNVVLYSSFQPPKAAAQATVSGFSNMKPEPWAGRGLTNGFCRPRLPTARHGRLQALGLSRHITTRNLESRKNGTVWTEAAGCTMQW